MIRPSLTIKLFPVLCPHAILAPASSLIIGSFIGHALIQGGFGGVVQFCRYLACKIMLEVTELYVSQEQQNNNIINTIIKKYSPARMC